MKLSLKLKVCIFIWIFCVITIVFIYGLYLTNRNIKIGEGGNENVYSNLSNFCSIKFEIEKIERKKNLLHISGWAIKPGELFRNSSSEILIKSPDGLIRKSRTFTYERSDVGEIFSPNHDPNPLSNYDHDFAGLSTVLDLTEFHGNGPFKIILHFDNGITNEYIDTNKIFYISDFGK